MRASALPKFYETWLGTLESPIDSGAFDCDACFMVKPAGLTRDLGPFKPTVKCCTFHPFLPSFTIGALIALEKTPLSVIEEYLAESRLTPLGAFPRRPGKSICETGKNQNDACLFLSKDGAARCTIRDFRPSTCAGYVCRSTSGLSGLKVWQDWELKLKRFEWTLAHETSFELGRTLDDVDVEFRTTEEARAYFAQAYVTALRLKTEAEPTAGDTVQVLS